MNENTADNQTAEPSSLLGAAEQTAGTETTSATSGRWGDWRDEVPEKFFSNKETGEVNYQNLVKSYRHLEGRLGAGDAPPSEAAKYDLSKIELPESVDPKMLDGLKEFAHQHKLTQAQAESVFGKFFEELPSYVQAALPNPATCETTLRETWKDQATFDKGIKDARKAFSAYAPEGLDINAVGNIPQVIQLLANIGKDMPEDGGVNTAAILPAETLADLKASPAYMNRNHPDHARVMARITAHFNNAFKSR